MTTNNFSSVAVDIDLVSFFFSEKTKIEAKIQKYLNYKLSFLGEYLQLEKQIVSKEQSRQYPDLSGDIAGTKANKIPSLETDFDTLNEPVWDTVVSFCVISLFFSSFECIYFVFLYRIII